jgi:hypothetical protein
MGKLKKPSPPISALIRQSGKALGALALPLCCLRCYWLRLAVRSRLPFALFPGIFASIDSYTKRVVRDWYAAHSKLPPWLRELRALRPCDKVPGHSQFQVIDSKYQILLTGVPDEILLTRRGCIIVDFKTARFTGKQDQLLAMYTVQLNAYALIAEACGFPRVEALFLIYMEPATDFADSYTDHCSKDGFRMDFRPHILKVEQDRTMLPPLLAKTRELFELPSPPPAHPACEDCQKLQDVTEALTRKAG